MVSLIGNLVATDGASAGALSAPTGLSASSGDSQVILTWDTMPDADSYTVKRATSLTGTYANLQTGITSTSFTDEDIINSGATTTPMNPYYYVVSADNTAGESNDSISAGATARTNGQVRFTMTPNQGSYITGNSITLRIETAAISTDMDTVQIRLAYDNTRLSFNNVDYTASTFNTAGGPLDDGTTYVEFSRGHTGGPLNGAQVVADVTFDVTADSGSEAEIMFDLTRTFAILAGTGQAVSTSNSRYTI